MNKKPISILILGEKSDWLDSITKFLKEKPYQLEVASNEKDIYEKIRLTNREYEVVLIDLLLAKEIGLDLLNEIKIKYSDIEIIFLIEKDFLNARNVFLDGAFHYFIKLYDPEYLVLLINHAAEHRYLKHTVQEIHFFENFLNINNMHFDDKVEQKILNRILENILLVGFDIVHLCLLSDNRKLLNGKAQVGGEEQFAGLQWPVVSDPHMQILLDRIQSRMSEKNIKDPIIDNEWISLPLLFENTIIGRVSVSRNFIDNPIKPEEIHQLSLLSSQIAIVLENIRKFRYLLQGATDLEILRQSALAITSPLDRDETLTKILQQSVLLLNAKSGGIDEYNSKDNSITIIAEFGRRTNRVGRLIQKGKGVVGTLIDSDLPFLIIDDYSLWSNRIEDFHDRQFNSVIAVPLVWQGKRIGAIYLDDDKTRKFTNEDAKLLSLFADQIAIALVHANTLYNLKNTKDRLDKLIANSFDAIITADANGLITDFNSQAEQILDFQAEEVIGKPARDYYYDSEEPNKIEKLLKESLGGKLADYFTEIKNKNGDRIPIRLSVTWLFDNNGKKIGSAGYFRDLREIQEVELHRQMLLEASIAVVKAKKLEDGLASLSKILVESCTGTFCSILMFSPDYKNLVVKAAYPFPRSDKLKWTPGIGMICSIFKDQEANELLMNEDPIVIRRGTLVFDNILNHVAKQNNLTEPVQSLLVIPLCIDKNHLGVCLLGEVRSNNRNQYAGRRIELAKSIATQTAIFIEKIRLNELTEQRVELLTTLQNLALGVSSTLNSLNDTLNKTCEAAVRLLGVDHSGLVLFESDYSSGKVVAEYPTELNTKETIIPIMEIPIERKLIQNKESITIDDVENEEGLGSYKNKIYFEFGIKSTVLIPVVYKGELLGSFSLDMVQSKRQFSSDEINFCQIFAAHVATAIKNARLYQESEKHNQLLTALDHASRHIRAEKDPAKLLHEIVQVGSDLIEAKFGGLFLNNPHMKELELVAVYGLPSDLIGKRIKSEEGVIGQISITGELFQTTNYLALNNCDSLFKSCNFKTFIGIPLKYLGEIEAILFVANDSVIQSSYTSSIDVLQRFVVQASIVLHTSLSLTNQQRQLSQLAILRRISEYSQVADTLDKIFHVILTGVTAGYGLGLNRAALLKIDSKNAYLVGHMGIGHIDIQEARLDWENYHRNGMDDFGHYIEALERGDLPSTPIDNRMRGLCIPIDLNFPNTFTKIIQSKEFVLIEHDNFDQLPDLFVKAFEPATPMVVIAITARNRVLGFLVADNKFTQAPITNDDIELLITFANTAAVAIENQEYFNRAKMAQNKIRSSYEASNSLVLSPITKKVMEDIIIKIQEASGSSWTSAILFDDFGNAENLFTTDKNHNIDVSNVIRPEGITVEVIRTGKPKIIEDVIKEQSYVNPRMLKNKVGAAICLPFSVQGKRIGAMWIHYDKPKEFPDYEIESIQLFVNQAAIAYEASSKMEHLEQLRRASEKLSDAKDLQDVLDRIVDCACDLLGADSAAIWSYDTERKRIIPANSTNRGIPDSIWIKFQNLELHPGGTVEAILENEWIAVNDIQNSKEYPYLAESTRQNLARMNVRSFQGTVLRVGGENVGVLYLNYNKMRSFSTEERDIIRIYADDAAVVLKNSLLREQVNKAKKVSEVISSVMASEEIDITLDSVAHGTQYVLDCDAVVLFVYNRMTGILNHPPKMVGVNHPEKAKRYGKVQPNSLVYILLHEKKPYIVENMAIDPLFKDRRFGKDEKIQSCVAIPLMAGNNSVGVMFVNYRTKHRFIQNELNIMESFANQAAVAIHNAQLHEDAKDKAKALEGLFEAGKAISSTLSLKIILDHILEQACILTGITGKKAYCGYLGLVENNHLRFYATYPQRFLPSLTKQLGEINLNGTDRIGVMGQAVNTGCSILIKNVHGDPHYLPFINSIHSVLAVPIKIGDLVIGAINVEHKDEDIFDDNDKLILESLAAQAGVAIQNSRQYEDLMKIKGYVGSQTAVDWMQMVSSSWGHSIIREVGVSLASLHIIRQALRTGNIEEALIELDDVEKKVQDIGGIPITAPLSANAKVGSIHINSVIEKFVKNLWSHSEYNDINLDLQLGLADESTVRISEEWLKQGLGLIIDNAMWAMKNSNKKRSTITLKTRRTRRFAEISILDTGPGIPDQIMSIIFKKPIEKPEGSRGAGVGLVLASTIFNAYQGTIEVKNTGPMGTLIVITLPLEMKN